MSAKTKVLVIDDSAVVRQALRDLIDDEPDLEVIGTATDPYQAVTMMREQRPDVITLDIEMPRMDGLTFLEKLMRQHPIPVVICSSLAAAGAESTLRALELGAVDIITKPRLGTKEFLEEARLTICDAVRGAAVARLRHGPVARPVEAKLSADAVIAPGTASAMIETTDKVIVVGASTGGTEALTVLLRGMPADAPGIVAVQHMPENFTRSFAQRLDALCAIAVKEAATNDPVLPGHALIAPGGHHTLLKRNGARYFVEVRDGPFVSRHRPSVDVLFRSAARYAGRNAVGVIMTGMGDDGARGMLELHEAGAHTIAQDEASSVVFGMPKEAIRAGGVDRVLPLEQLAGASLLAARRPVAAASG